MGDDQKVCAMFRRGRGLEGWAADFYAAAMGRLAALGCAAVALSPTGAVKLTSLAL